jgi:hypothetical protein
MRRLIDYLNSLFLGVILGMIFVALVHTCPRQWQQKISITPTSAANEQAHALSR